MREQRFLAKLQKEGKLKLVNPSEEIKESYIEKSESNLISAKILLENDRLEEAISLAYYGMYNMLLALLFKIGIKSENHTGSIILLKELFNLSNSEISYAKKERIDKQYYTDFKVVKQEVEEAIKSSEDFSNKMLDFISKLSNKEIEDYRERFRGLI